MSGVAAHAGGRRREQLLQKLALAMKNLVAPASSTATATPVEGQGKYDGKEKFDCTHKYPRACERGE
jgi:hypothetical protein